jgi:hypothetical protein
MELVELRAIIQDKKAIKKIDSLVTSTSLSDVADLWITFL